MVKLLANQSIKNIVVGLVSKIIVMLLPFFVRTAIINTLGNIYVGVDSLFVSILNMLSLSELGFSSAIVYSMYKPVAENDNEKIAALLDFYKKVYRIVGSVILLGGLILLPNIEMFIAEGTEYPTDINIHIVFLVFLINTSISYFFFAYKNALLIATMRNDIHSVIEMCRSMASHLLQIAVLVIFKNYYLFVIVLPIVTLANNFAINVVVNKRYPQYLSVKSKLDKQDRKDILTRVGALIGNKLGAVVFTSVDSIVISSFLGLVILGKYTNYYSILAAVYAIESTVFSAIQSTIGNVLVTKTKERSYSIFKTIFTLNMAVSAFCTCCFLVLYQPFMELWLGKENLLGYEITVWLAIYYFVKSTRHTLFMFKEAAGMWKETFWMPYVSVVVNLILNILMVQIIGLAGVIISSIAALVFVEMPWETTVFFRKFLKMKMLPYIRKIFISVILCFAVGLSSITLGSWLVHAIPNLVLQIVILLLMCLLITAAVYIPIIRCSKESSNIIQLIKNKKGKEIEI